MIETRLFPGEKLLWSGQPWQGVFLLRPIDLFARALQRPLVRTGSRLPRHDRLSGGEFPPFPFILIVLIFPIIGLYAVFGRFLIDAWLRSATSYAVTSQRVLIERKGMFRSQRSLDIDRLPAPELNERADGSGTIRFGTTSWFARNGMGIWSASTDPVPQFLRIENVRDVYALIVKQHRSDLAK